MRISFQTQGPRLVLRERLQEIVGTFLFHEVADSCEYRPHSNGNVSMARGVTGDLEDKSRWAPRRMSDRYLFLGLSIGS